MSAPDANGTVIRVQDKFGRGPYRPGMTELWRDYAGGFDCPPWWEELGLGIVEAHSLCVGDYHFGCGFRSWEQLRSWFSTKERAALSRLGYKLWSIDPAVIVAETPRQVVFGSVAPLNAPSAQPVKLASKLAERVFA